MEVQNISGPDIVKNNMEIQPVQDQPKQEIKTNTEVENKVENRERSVEPSKGNVLDSYA